MRVLAYHYSSLVVSVCFYIDMIMNMLACSYLTSITETCKIPTSFNSKHKFFHTRYETGTLKEFKYTMHHERLRAVCPPLFLRKKINLLNTFQKASPQKVLIISFFIEPTCANLSPPVLMHGGLICIAFCLSVCIKNY